MQIKCPTCCALSPAIEMEEVIMQKGKRKELRGLRELIKIAKAEVRERKTSKKISVSAIGLYFPNIK